MKNKILCTLLAGSLIFGLTACGGNTPAETDDSDATEVTIEESVAEEDEETSESTGNPDPSMCIEDEIDENGHYITHETGSLDEIISDDAHYDDKGGEEWEETRHGIKDTGETISDFVAEYEESKDR